MMFRTKATLLASAVVMSLGVVAIPTAGQASIILGDVVDLSGTGYGAAPRLLTLNTPQGSTTETGGVEVTGPPLTVETVGDFQPPPTDDPPGSNNPHNNVITLGSVGWLTGADVLIGIDAVEQGNDTTLNLEAVNLRIYDSTGVEQASFELDPTLVGSLITEATGAGRGIQTLLLDAAQQLAFDALGVDGSFLASIWTATFSNASAGSDSFLALNSSAVIPLPGAVVLFGTGLVGLTLLGRRRRSRRANPVAA